jgi:hypothetical protein
MSAGLREPIPALPRPSLRPHAGGQTGQARGQVVSVLGGWGLVVGGLLYGSWPGGAVAALGGLLLYHGLSRSRYARRARAVLPAPPPAVEEVAGPTPTPLATEGPGSSAAEPEPAQVVPAPSADGQTPASTAVGDGAPTPEESARVQVRAYFYALERGGGVLPSFDRARAEADYWRALTEVRAERQEFSA